MKKGPASTPQTPVKGGRKKKEEPEQKVWKWWEEEKKDDGMDSDEPKIQEVVGGVEGEESTKKQTKKSRLLLPFDGNFVSLHRNRSHKLATVTRMLQQL